MTRIQFTVLALALCCFGLLHAQPSAGSTDVLIERGFPWQGLSLFTIVMVLLYAAHVAQDRTSLSWRIVLFILGFPLTFLASFLVYPGSQRLLGVDLPRRGPAAREHGGSATDAAETAEQQRERRATWQHTVSVLIGISMVLVFAPSSQFRTEAMQDGQYAVEETVYWGFWDSPWLSYKREGVLQPTGDVPWAEPEWRTARQWQFEASLEAVFTLFALLVLFALCVADERRRSRSSATGSVDPTR